MKFLVFDIWGDYGHFKRIYTTSSPLTYSVPPPSTVKGILGAILGLDKFQNEYLKIFDQTNTKLAIKIINPVKKVRIPVNWVDTKRSPKYFKEGTIINRTQIRLEVLKAPKFRIYLNHSDDNVLNKLKEYISSHKCVYTVSLGLSEFLADFKFIGLYDAEIISEQNIVVDIDTVINKNNILDLKIEEGKKYFKENMPMIMDHTRTVSEYSDIVFEVDGKPIKANLKTYFKLANNEIVGCII